MTEILSTRRCGTCGYVGDETRCPRCSMLTVEYIVQLKE